MEQRKYRFRWWEALAAGICVVIIFGLLLPAVQTNNYEPRRRSQCQNNLKQLSLATSNFETNRKQYPGYQNLFADKGGQGKIGSWAVSLLPAIEEVQLRDLWDDPNNQLQWEAEFTGASKTETFYPAIPTFVCPSDITKDNIRAPLSYLANTGLYLRPDDPALQLTAYAGVADPSEQSSISQRVQNGVFANGLPPTVFDPGTGSTQNVFGVAKSPTRARDIRDGLSSTILFSEGLGHRSWSDVSIRGDQARFKVGVAWLYAGNKFDASRPRPTAAPDFGQTILTVPTYDNGPASLHSGIVNVAFADGSVRTIDEQIDYHVLQALMTPQTAHSDVPAPNYILKSADYQP